jgi:hypothetical protein
MPFMMLPVVPRTLTGAQASPCRCSRAFSYFWDRALAPAGPSEAYFWLRKNGPLRPLIPSTCQAKGANRWPRSWFQKLVLPESTIQQSENDPLAVTR